MAAIVGAGAVGINLEDSGAPGGGLFDSTAQAARIRAARAAATDAGLPELVINARTDVFLFEIGEPEGRLDDVLARAAAYAEAGADSLFVPGLLDLGTLAILTSTVSLPVNVMAGPGAPDVATLRAAGVRRVSLGQAITQAAYTLARQRPRLSPPAPTTRSQALTPSATSTGYSRPADQPRRIGLE